MSWNEVVLGSAIHIKHGFAFKGDFFVDQGDYIVLTPGNFYESGGFKSRPEKDRAYAGDIPENYILNEGDLIVAMTEQGEGLLGSAALVPQTNRFLHNQRLGLIDKVDETIFDRRFLYLLLNTRSVRAQISGSATGTKVRHTAPERIYRVRATVPNVSTQSAIADAVLAYDDLIDNNRRRMALLEDSARQLYREWFVRLRFPGHKHTPIVDGVPQGWEKVKVGSLLLKGIKAKKIQKGEYLDNGSTPCIDQGSSFIGGYTNDDDARIVAPLPLIVFGDHTRVLKYVDFPFAIGADGTQLIAPNSSRLSVEYLFYALQSANISNHFYARHFKFLKEESVLIPAESLMREFSSNSKAGFEQITLLRTQNQKLRQARDLLLPRLMNGELAV
jgi:type I restriction enzyme, S subunit